MPPKSEEKKIRKKQKKREKKLQAHQPKLQTENNTVAGLQPLCRKFGEKILKKKSTMLLASSH
jgi:hypothetical protein